MILVVQIVSGILLAMFYCPNEKFAFLSVAELSWDIFNGHFLRYFHANEASMFFCVFICIWEKAFIMVGIER